MDERVGALAEHLLGRLCPRLFRKGPQTYGEDLAASAVEHHAGIIEISVRDSGPGVKDIDLERIFEPFVTTKSTGLGMGLSISRSILDAHGGRMWATRNSEHGLTGHIELSHEGRVRDDER